MSNLKPAKGKNIIISAHETLLEKKFSMKQTQKLHMNENDYKLDLDEGGFFVISNNDSKLILEHQYYNYNDFARSLTKRPIN